MKEIVQIGFGVLLLILVGLMGGWTEDIWGGHFEWPTLIFNVLVGTLGFSLIALFIWAFI